MSYWLYQDVARLDMASEMHVIRVPPGIRPWWYRWIAGPVGPRHCCMAPDPGLARSAAHARRLPRPEGTLWIARHLLVTGDSRFIGARGAIHQERSFALVGIYSGRLDKESDIGLVWRRPAIEQIVEVGRPTDVQIVPLDSAARKRIQAACAEDSV